MNGLLSPAQFLIVAVLALVTIWVVDSVATRRRSRRLRRLATSLRLRYSPLDRFNLAPRIAGALPDPGAADVRVRDLMYRSVEGRYEYIFTVSYRIGSVSGTRRSRCVVRVTEPHGRSSARLGEVAVADGSLLVREQYTSLVQDPELAG